MAPATFLSGQVSTGNSNEAAFTDLSHDGDGPRKRKRSSEPEFEGETHHPKRRKDP